MRQALLAAGFERCELRAIGPHRCDFPPLGVVIERNHPRLEPAASTGSSATLHAASTFRKGSSAIPETQAGQPNSVAYGMSA